jgi:hypothetical protein
MAPLTCECDRINVQLPSLICDPTIAKDPKRTPAKVSLADLEELQRKFLSNHVINGHNLVSKLSICFGRYHYNQGNMFRQTKHTYREKKAVEREIEKENTKSLLPGSLTVAIVSIRCAVGRDPVYCKSC